jgi:ABC-type nickel/cobalt efflux system permease component RcnA
MLKKLLLLGAVSTLLSGVAAVIYQKNYAHWLGADFAGIVKPANIITVNIIGGLLAATGFWLLNTWLRGNTEIILTC